MDAVTALVHGTERDPSIGRGIDPDVGCGAFLGTLAALPADIERTDGRTVESGEASVERGTSAFVRGFASRDPALGERAIGSGVALVVGAAAGLVAAWTFAVDFGVGVALGVAAGLIVAAFAGETLVGAPATDRENAGVTR
jgi:hypothetical protein